VPIESIPNPAPSGGDWFGYSVGISGDGVAVGSWFGDNGALNAGSVHVFDLGSGTPTVPVADLSNPVAGGTGNDFFGFSVGISGSRVVVGAEGEDANGSDAGRAYVYDVAGATPNMATHTLNQPVPDQLNYFGSGVAVDGTRVVVGARGDDTGAGFAGSAYVFDLAGVTPLVPVAELNNPAPSVFALFGVGVAISGTTVVVGADRDDTAASDSGAAYVYDIAGATPTTPIASLFDPTPTGGESFGLAVAIDGANVVGGSHRDDVTAANSGAAHYFDLAGATPETVAQTFATPGPSLNDQFGDSVAVSGTFLVVGSRYDDTGAPDAGIALVYDLASGTPSVPIATLENPSPSNNDFFGDSVAISGSLVAVGSRLDDATSLDAGRVYVYDLAGPTPAVPIHIIENPDTTVGGLFGGAVAMSGNRLVVGARGNDPSDAGSVYVFDLAGASPTVPEATLPNPDPASGDRFGDAVAISGNRVVVGTPRDDAAGINAGRAYVFDLTAPVPATPVLFVDNPDPPQGNYAEAVAISGQRVAVAGTLHVVAAQNAGAVFIHDLTAANPAVPSLTLNNPFPAFGDRFGSSVSLSSTRVLVGASLDDGAGIDVGQTYVFDLTQPVPTSPVATLSPPAGQGGSFGAAVAIDGLVAVIGAPTASVITIGKGAAHAFVAATPSPEIAVEEPLAVDLIDNNETISYGTLELGTPSAAKTFAIRNDGQVDLTGIGVALTGTHSADFTLDTTGTATSLAADASTTFTITFTSGGSGSTGILTAGAEITSNDADESPFEIALTGTALSNQVDTDSDGLNDLAEFQLAALGFDWQVPNLALVTTLFDGAEEAGLFTEAQVQAMNVDRPIIGHNPGTGTFTLTLALHKSTDLITFDPFPFTLPDLSVNPQGKLEFEFTPVDDVAFFRIETEDLP